jgi:molybdopterin converting factor small subunit
MTATILPATGDNIAAIISALAGTSISQVVIDEQDVAGSLAGWFTVIRDDLSTNAAQVWVITRQDRLGDVLTDGDEIFGKTARLGISTWDTGGRGAGGFSSETKLIVVWRAGPAARAVNLGRTKKVIRRPLTRKGRKDRELEFPAGSLVFDTDQVHPSATYGSIRVASMTVVDGENWGSVKITGPFTVDQEALNTALAEGSKVSIIFDGEQSSVVCLSSQDAGRPFPSLLSPRLSNVTGVAEAVRVTREITGKRVARAVPETLAELIIAAGSRRGDMVLTVGGECAAIPAAAVIGHRDVMHLTFTENSMNVASARLAAAGGKVDVRKPGQETLMGETE